MKRTRGFLLLVAPLSTCVSTYGATHVVSNGMTIQSALTAASDGDPVLVQQGVYSGDGNRDLRFYGKDIALMSEDGIAVTTIHCGGSLTAHHRAIIFDGGEGRSAVVQGFWISSASELGGGIFVEWVGGDMSGNSVIYNRAARGAGICCGSRTTLSLSGLTVQHNEADSCGGGMFLYDNSAALDDSDILTNYAYSGDGSGIYCEVASPQITNCRFDGNIADVDSGGGLAADEISNPLIEGCEFNENWARNSGGGVMAHGRARIRDCRFEANEASLGDGGGMCALPLLSERLPTLTNCIFTLNRARLQGGGLAAFGPFREPIEFCSFLGDSAAFGGGVSMGGDGL